MSDREVNTALNFIDMKVQLVLDGVAQGIVNEAKRLCIIGEYKDGRVGGRLRGSISWSDNTNVKMYEKAGEGTGAKDSDKIDKAPDRNTRWIGTNVEYGIYKEFGIPSKPNYPSHPYLRPAAKQAKRILRQIVAKVKSIRGNIK